MPTVLCGYTLTSSGFPDRIMAKKKPPPRPSRRWAPPDFDGPEDSEDSNGDVDDNEDGDDDYNEPSPYYDDEDESEREPAPHPYEQDILRPGSTPHLNPFMFEINDPEDPEEREPHALNPESTGFFPIDPTSTLNQIRSYIYDNICPGLFILADNEEKEIDSDEHLSAFLTSSPSRHLIIFQHGDNQEILNQIAGRELSFDPFEYIEELGTSMSGMTRWEFEKFVRSDVSLEDLLEEARKMTASQRALVERLAGYSEVVPEPGLKPEQESDVPKVESAPLGDAEVVHSALCDHCQIQIRGIRYKCISCRDYDLCSACEAIQSTKPFHESVHPFAKLRKASQNPVHFY